MGTIVVIPMLLNCDIGQMDKSVVKIIGSVFVLGIAKACKPKVAQVALQWLKRKHQYIQPQIKLLATYEQWSVYIPTNNI